MSSFILISLLTVGFACLIFDDPEEDDRDVADEDHAVDDFVDDNASHPISSISDNDDDDEINSGSPNLPDDQSLDQSDAENGVFIALSNETGESGNTLIGGSGDDVIRTSKLPDYDGNTSLNWFASHLGAGKNLVFGGSGDDIVESTDGDTVFGGTGSDTLIFFTDPDRIDQDNSEVKIKDFEQGNDVIIVQLPPDVSIGGDTTRQDLYFKIDLNFEEGNSIVRFDGQVVLVIEGIQALSIGVPDDGDLNFPIEDIHRISDVRDLHLLSLDGTPIESDVPDVIISSFARL